jgi:hypothetical protein
LNVIGRNCLLGRGRHCFHRQKGSPVFSNNFFIVLFIFNLYLAGFLIELRTVRSFFFNKMCFLQRGIIPEEEEIERQVILRFFILSLKGLSHELYWAFDGMYG